MLEIIERIQNKLEKGMNPGLSAQMQMVPERRRAIFEHIHGESQPIPSAVLLLFHVKEGKVFFPLIQRTEDSYVHSKQVSLPGGRFEDNDSNLIYTAYRETNEEIGIDIDKIRYLGRLTDLYIPPSNFIVTPIVGYIEKKESYQINTKEVEYVFEVSLDELLDDTKIRHIKMTLEDETYDVPYFHFSNHVVWGATAMILNELKELIKNSDTL